MAKRTNNGNKREENDSRNKRTSTTGRNSGRSRKQTREDGDSKSAAPRVSGQSRVGSGVLANNAANIDFNWPAGTYTNLRSDYIDGFSIPGLFSIEVAPTIGGCVGSIDDPINRASTIVWQRLRGKKSLSGPYEPCDVGILSIGLSTAVLYLTWLKRLYKLARLHSGVNKYMPRTLIKANHVDFDDLRMNAHLLREQVNQMANALMKFNLPVCMAYFSDTEYLYANVFAESETLRDQLYMFVPAGFHTYFIDVENEDYRGHLKWHSLADIEDEFGHPYLLTTDLIAFGWNMINALANDTDMFTLSADIGDAYDSGEIYKYSYLEEDAFIVPLVDIVLLNQIKNSNRVPIVQESLDIMQDTDVDFSGPVGLLTQYIKHGGTDGSLLRKEISDFLKQERLLSVPSYDVTVNDIMLLTRFMITAADPIKQSVGKYSDGICCGMEVITQMYVWTLDSAGAPTFEAVGSVTDCTTGSYDAWAEVISDIARLRSFKYAPSTFVYYITESGALVPVNAIPFAEVDNYTFLAPERLARIHDVAMLAVFGLDI